VPAAVFVKHRLITPRNVDLLYPLDARADLNIDLAMAARTYSDAAAHLTAAETCIAEP
jgi:hypothetical protein